MTMQSISILSIFKQHLSYKVQPNPISTHETNHFIRKIQFSLPIKIHVENRKYKPVSSIYNKNISDVSLPLEIQQVASMNIGLTKPGHKAAFMPHVGQKNLIFLWRSFWLLSFRICGFVILLGRGLG